MAKRLTQRRSLQPDRRGNERRAGERRTAGRTDAYDARLDVRNPDELIGFAVHTADGALGRIDDLRVEEESWAIAEIVVLARRGRSARRLVLPPSAIERVDRPARRIYMRQAYFAAKQ